MVWTIWRFPAFVACDLLSGDPSTNRMLPNRERARLGSPELPPIVGTEKGPDSERGFGPFFFPRFDSLDARE
jgi:hypothetical protein